MAVGPDSAQAKRQAAVANHSGEELSNSAADMLVGRPEGLTDNFLQLVVPIELQRRLSYERPFNDNGGCPNVQLARSCMPLYLAFQFHILNSHIY
jgi:hypothetical protein